jgi:hypothetical protein
VFKIRKLKPTRHVFIIKCVREGEVKFFLIKSKFFKQFWVRCDVNVKSERKLFALVKKSLDNFVKAFHIREHVDVRWAILSVIPDFYDFKGKQRDIIPILIFLEDKDEVMLGDHCVALETHHSATLLLPRIESIVPGTLNERLIA